jgi:hypothetical protein
MRTVRRLLASPHATDVAEARALVNALLTRQPLLQSIAAKVPPPPASSLCVMMRDHVAMRVRLRVGARVSCRVWHQALDVPTEQG